MSLSKLAWNKSRMNKTIYKSYMNSLSHIFLSTFHPVQFTTVLIQNQFQNIIYLEQVTLTLYFFICLSNDQRRVQRISSHFRRLSSRVIFFFISESIRTKEPIPTREEDFRSPGEISSESSLKESIKWKLLRKHTLKITPKRQTIRQLPTIHNRFPKAVRNPYPKNRLNIKFPQLLPQNPVWLYQFWKKLFSSCYG